jgi:7-carboxy-7-deazaguanine synthase
MKVSDLFFSVQGEGVLAGMPSAFVRTSGCNLRCRWCDTPYTSWAPDGDDLSIQQILDRLCEFATRHVVVTGGEPLLASGIEELCRELRVRGYHITVETAATVFKPIACDLASLSPKLSNSTPHHIDGGRAAARHDSLRLRLDVVQAFIDHCDYQLKFVVDKPADVDEIQVILEDLELVDRTKVLLMPQGITREELVERGPWVAELCKKYGFRYCPRLHIELFGNRRGT